MFPKCCAATPASTSSTDDRSARRTNLISREILPGHFVKKLRKIHSPQRGRVKSVASFMSWQGRSAMRPRKPPGQPLRQNQKTRKKFVVQLAGSQLVAVYGDVAGEKSGGKIWRERGKGVTLHSLSGTERRSTSPGLNKVKKSRWIWRSRKKRVTLLSFSAPRRHEH